MRISELSRRSGVSNATIKYYLREGLLPPGRATAATQAEYDEAHLRRLRLIRALIGVRGLSVAAAKQVIDAIAEHRGDTHHLLGLVFGIWPADAGRREERAAAGADGTRAGAGADELVRAMGWSVSAGNPARQVIDSTIGTLRSLGMDQDWRALVPYAELAEATARHDLDLIQPLDDPLEKAERAVLMTFLLEPALMALRRLAQENESAVRYGGMPKSPEAGRPEPPAAGDGPGS